jgi:hypothetical protein
MSIITSVKMNETTNSIPTSFRPWHTISATKLDSQTQRDEDKEQPPQPCLLLNASDVFALIILIPVFESLIQGETEAVMERLSQQKYT